MKLKFATILCAFAAMFSMASCTEEILGVGELPPLAGEVVLTDVVDAGAVRISPNYVFTLELKNASGVTLEAKFASASTTLDAGTYTEASPAYAVAGNFITGAEGTKLTVDGETHLVTAGTLKVGLEGGSYSLSGVVKVDNGNNYSIEWAGAPLTWGEVLVVTKLNTVMQTQVNQNQTITVKVADAGVEFTASQYGPQVTGGKGNYLAVDFYSEDGYLAAGTYTPAANPQAPKKGEYVPGYVFEQVWGDQVFALNYGSNWYTVDAASTPMESCEHLTKGNITVSAEGEVFTITVDNNEIYAQFVGAIPEITKPATPPVLLGDYPYFVGMTDQYADYKQVILQFTSSDKVKNTGSGWTGTGKFLNLTINAVKDGDNLYIPTGMYEAADGASKPNKWQITGGMPEYNFYWGSYIYDVADGTATLVELKDGTIWVGAKAGEYIIHMNHQGKDFLIYQGKIKGLLTPADNDGGYVAPEPDEPENEGGACGCDCDGCQDCTGPGTGSGDAEGEYVNLTTYINTSNYHAQYGNHLMGFELGTNGIVAEAWTYEEYSGVNAKGNGNVLKIEFYTADGKLAAGTYKPSAKNGELAEGEFNLGVEADYNGQKYVSGSAWQTYANDKKTAEANISDGTVTV